MSVVAEITVPYAPSGTVPRTRGTLLLGTRQTLTPHAQEGTLMSTPQDPGRPDDQSGYPDAPPPPDQGQYPQYPQGPGQTGSQGPGQPPYAGGPAGSGYGNAPAYDPYQAPGFGTPPTSARCSIICGTRTASAISR